MLLWVCDLSSARRRVQNPGWESTEMTVEQIETKLNQKLNQARSTPCYCRVESIALARLLWDGRRHVHTPPAVRFLLPHPHCSLIAGEPGDTSDRCHADACTDDACG